MAETSANITSSGTVPVDGVSVTVTPTALSGGQSIRQVMAIGDGAGTAGQFATVKAGSTASVAADLPLVVAVHPTSPLPTGSNVIGAVTQSAGPWTANVTQVGGVAVTAGTKGTQQTNAIPTQDMKDAGRTRVTYKAASIASVATETVITCAKNVGGVATTGVTTYTVTAGKTLRVQAFRLSARFATPSTTITFANVTLRLREASVSGAEVITHSLMCASNLPTAPDDLAIPDGLEFPAGTVLNFTQIASATTLLVDVEFVGYEY